MRGRTKEEYPIKQHSAQEREGLTECSEKQGDQRQMDTYPSCSAFFMNKGRKRPTVAAKCSIEVAANV